MEHSRAQELFSEYLDGELDVDTQEQLDEHLEGCPECSREFESLQSLVKTVSSLQQVKAPTDFVAGVRERVRRHGRGSFFQQGFGWERKIPFEAISMVLLGILLALYIILVMLPGKPAPSVANQPVPILYRDGGVRQDGATSSDGGVARDASPASQNTP